MLRHKETGDERRGKVAKARAALLGQSIDLDLLRIEPRIDLQVQLAHAGL